MPQMTKPFVRVCEQFVTGKNNNTGLHKNQQCKTQVHTCIHLQDENKGWGKTKDVYYHLLAANLSSEYNIKF